ncbi:unnamed protein product [Calypogeia fissa]
MMTRSKMKTERKRKLDEESVESTDRKRINDEGSSNTTQIKPRSLALNPLLHRYLQIGTLLPGIPDDVTTQVLSPILPGNEIHTLSSVSSAWQKSIQSGDLFEATVRFNSTDKLAVMNYCLQEGKTYGIAVYSFGDKAFYSLPPIPGITSGIPQGCECVTLDGKIYILGGFSWYPPPSQNITTRHGSTSDVYMLDLARQRPWRKCASMQASRWRFGSGIIGGKIYVCGGSSHLAPVNVTEVYDPKEDAWTELEPMPIWESGHKFGVVEDQLLVFGEASPEGVFWRPVSEDCVQIYNPIRDEWRRLPPGTGSDDFGNFFVAKGKLHSITPSQIFVYDFETNSKTLLHSVSQKNDGRGPDIYLFAPIAILAIEDELLAIQFAKDCTLSEHTRAILSARYSGLQCGYSRVVVRSKGFGTEGKEIVWERVECSLDLEHLWSRFIHPLQL